MTCLLGQPRQPNQMFSATAAAPRLCNIIDKLVEIDTISSVGKQDASPAECGVVMNWPLDPTLSGSTWEQLRRTGVVGLSYSSLSRVMGSERMRRPVAW